MNIAQKLYSLGITDQETPDPKLLVLTMAERGAVHFPVPVVHKNQLNHHPHRPAPVMVKPEAGEERVGL